MNNIDKFYTKNPIAFAGAYLEYVAKVLKAIDVEEIGRFVATLLDARERGATVFFIGNGGSRHRQSFCQRFIYRDPFLSQAISAIIFTDNVAILTAVGNDFGYEEIFYTSVARACQPGDVLVGISASGNSPNVLRAFEYAQDGIQSVGLTSRTAGR